MKVVGQSVRRADGAAKVTGAARYAVDRQEVGMLHARLLRSPVPAGRIGRLDIGGARAMPGVHAVLTGDDTPERTGIFLADQHLLARDVVRYAGEPVVAVAADSLEVADAALAAVVLEIVPTLGVTDPESALAPGAPLVHPEWASYPGLPDDWPREGNLLGTSMLVRGDVDAAFSRDDLLVIEDEVRVPRQHQTYLEPRCAVARYEAGRCTIHCSTQFPFMVRDRCAAALGVGVSDVRVRVDTVGGGFGGKLDVGPEPFAALLARHTGRPVRLAWTRPEEFVAAAMRENAVLRIRSAVTRKGDLVAQEADAVMDAGAYAGETPYLGLALAFATAYRVPAVRLRCRIAYTNTPPTGPFRGICGPYVVLAVEQHMDHIARELGLDRRELRLRHVYRAGDAYPNGQVLEAPAFLDAFARMEAVAPWEDVSATRPLRGVGITCVSWMTNPLAGSVTVKVHEDGTVGLVTAATDIGSGAVSTGLVQLVAEDLGVGPDDVVVPDPDTDAASFDAGAQGSRTTYNAGNAALKATAALRSRIFALAAPRLGCDAGALELAGGQVVVRDDPTRGVDLGDIARAALADRDGPLAATGTSASVPAAVDPEPGSVGVAREAYFNAPTFHVHLAEVEVCPATGRVSVVRYVVVQDVGRAINPTAIEGQIHGGVAQGIGYALYEGIRLEDGIVVDRDLESYRVPGALDVPRIESVLLESHDPAGPMGAKGVGEPPIVPVAGAIANAVADAVGVPFHELPITPFAVLAALRARDAAASAA